MTAHKDNYELLIEKLDQFIRKFYVNRLIRGTLYSVGLILLLFIAISVSEHYFYFSTNVRKTLFLSFVGISILALGYWVFAPLLNYFHLGKVISHEQAATIVGNHFTNVKDKLLNILQLKQQSENTTNSDLVFASINQKTAELQPIPFKSAINLAQNRKYLRFALPPLFLLLILLIGAPSMIKDSTTRLINNGKEFERPAPFTFKVLNDDDLSVVQFDDFELEVEIEGETLPSDVFIEADNYQYKLTNTSGNTYTYKFSKVAKDTDFKLTANGFDSKKYTLETLKKPNILGFDIKLDYPNYTGRKDEIVSNIGDLVVPLGTKIKWTFSSQNTDDVAVRFSGQAKGTNAKRVGNELFELSKTQLRDETYMVYVSNEILQDADSVAYSMSVIPDVYPTINVEQFEDSAQAKILFFAGDASDDYGINSLTFNYKIDGEKQPKTLQSIPMSISKGKQTAYEYTWDLMALGLKPGDKMTYYFEVSDNDGVNGSKSTRTQLMSYSVPTVEEYKEMAADNNEEIKEDLKKAIEESKELKKDVREMKEKLIQKKELDWQDRKEIEKLLDRQKDLDNKIEEAKENFEENLKNQEEFEDTNPEIAEKQEQLQELFEEVLDDEMKELMQKMEELLQEMNRDEAMQELEDFEMSDEEVEKELDRMLELFKQLEFEHEMQQTMDELDEMAKKEEELSEETKDNKQSSEDLKKQQDELNEQFDKMQEKLDEMMKKNEELESPVDKEKMEELQQQAEDIQQEMQKSSQQLQQQQNQKASESQKKSSQKMKDMKNSMSMMMQSAQMEQMQEDIEALRQLLENLVNLSFDQEELMEDIKGTQINTPKYVEQVQQQYKLKDDFRLAEDSLNALAKRVFQIESFVTEKVTGINKNFKSSISELEERRKSTASVKQQRIMTGVNDLALMLSEVMEQMQQQMANQMSGSQMCQKPSSQSKGQKMQNMGKLQEQLNQQMKDMQNQMKGGKKQGKKSSKEFAQMAAKQAAIRKAMREIQDQKQQEGKGASKELQKIIDEMNKIETDLVNKQLTNEMMKRQQDILTRLLEAAEAERQQEMDNKREAKTAKNRDTKRPPALEEYIKKREAEIEMYKTVSPSLKPYYKTLVEEYYNSLKGQ